MYAKSLSKHPYYSFDKTQMPYAFFHNLAPNDLPSFSSYTLWSSWTIFSSSKISRSPSFLGLCTCCFPCLICSSPFFFTWPSLTHAPSFSLFSRLSFLNPKTKLCVFPMSFHSTLVFPCEQTYLNSSTIFTTLDDKILTMFITFNPKPSILWLKMVGAL